MVDHRTSVIDIERSMPAAIEPIELHNLPDRAAERLRESMLKGVLKPGERLVERDLAAQLGIGKTALREALIRLEHEGLVQRRRNTDTRVTVLSAKQVVEANQIRIALEPMAFIEAHPFLSPEVIKHSSDLIARMERASRRRDTRAYSTLDLEFHQSFWKLSGNQTLLKVLVNLCRPLFAYLMIELRNIPTDHLELPGNHEELLDAIQSGDRERIRSSLEHHIRDGWYPK